MNDFLNWLGRAALTVLGIFVGLWLIFGLLSWTSVSPWDDLSIFHHDGYPRQVTNVVYANQTVNTASRLPIVSVERVADVNNPTPHCLAQVGGRGVDKNGSGYSLTVMGANGDRVMLDIPDGMVHQVRYAGHVPRLQLHYMQLIAFYYDNFYDDLWRDSPSNGPKGDVVSCMQQISPSDRVLDGLTYVTVLEPVGYKLPA